MPEIEGGEKVEIFPGFINMFGGSSAPVGWLICDGTAISRTTYAGLFDVLSTTYGVGDGSTTFNLPNFKARAPVGVGQGTDDNAVTKTLSLGDSEGEYEHVLTVGELASHQHSFTPKASLGTGFIAGGEGINTTLTLSSSVGSDEAHENTQPVLCVNFIIKT